MASSFLEVSTFVLALVILGYAGWSDWKRREVEDWVWVMTFPLGGILTTIRTVLTGRPDPYFWVFGLIITIILAFTLSHIGLWGGADGKALICLALITPEMPSFANPILGIWITFLPFTVIFNAYLLSLSSLVYIASRNLWYKLRGGSLFEGLKLPLRVKILAFFAGYKVEKEKLLNSPSITLAERPEEPRKLHFTLRYKDSAVTLNGLPPKVWVSPQLPMLVFMIAGLVTAVLLGDLIFWIMFQTMSIFIKTEAVTTFLM